MAVGGWGLSAQLLFRRLCEVGLGLACGANSRLPISTGAWIHPISGQVSIPSIVLLNMRLKQIFNLDWK